MNTIEVTEIVKQYENQQLDFPTASLLLTTAGCDANEILKLIGPSQEVLDNV